MIAETPQMQPSVSRLRKGQVPFVGTHRAASTARAFGAMRPTGCVMLTRARPSRNIAQAWPLAAAASTKAASGMITTNSSRTGRCQAPSRLPLRLPSPAQPHLHKMMLRRPSTTRAYRVQLQAMSVRELKAEGARLGVARVAASRRPSSSGPFPCPHMRPSNTASKATHQHRHRSQR